MNSKKHYRVIIIGAGPAGIGAAVALSKKGVGPVIMIERNEQPGGIPSFYKKGGIRTFIKWLGGGLPVDGETYAAMLCRKLLKTGTTIRLKSQVIAVDTAKKSVTYVNADEGKVDLTADVVIMACGAREKNQAERGWIEGSRPARIFFTRHLLSLSATQETLPFRKPVIIGSDLIAYAAAAKLRTGGAAGVTVIDRYPRPRCFLLGRLFFRLWCNPTYLDAGPGPVKIEGTKTVTGVKTGRQKIACDSVIIAGDLIPNSELAIQGKLKADIRHRIPEVVDGCRLSEPGWFVTGNMLGGFHGAEWCYYHGIKAGKQVSKYLRRYGI